MRSLLGILKCQNKGITHREGRNEEDRVEADAQHLPHLVGSDDNEDVDCEERQAVDQVDDVLDVHLHWVTVVSTSGTCRALTRSNNDT